MNVERIKTRKKYNKLKNQLKSSNNSGFILPKFEKVDEYIIIVVSQDDEIMSSLFASFNDNNIIINGLYTPLKYRRNGYCSMLHKWLSENYKNIYNKIISMPLDLSESKYVYEKLGYKSDIFNDRLIYSLHLNS